ncbi:hypothetical protein CVT24_003737 [Panaeolus cyanescens]|uniref:TEA domain-containing protein n=1 Tax=Panaeolus cyanescens TaxID=181874 RepID=A0A409YXM2_9AGAR|nr:hypothetical protein CVT24_003737 [Panaeolus cyanescens]
MLPSRYTISTSSVEEFSSATPVYSGARGSGNMGSMPSHHSDPLATGQTTGRKTWKMTKSKKEAVWPQHLESALLKGLRKYKPASTKDPRHLLRFPRRNRFISEYIYETTGRVRTAKQVGSRLQQLRETCRDQRILDLILKKDFVISRSPSPSLETGSNGDNDSSHSPSPTLVSSNTTLSPHLSHRSLSSDGTASTLTSPVSIEFAHSAQPTVVSVQVALFDDEMVDYQQPQSIGTPFFKIDLDECGLIDAGAMHGSSAFVRRIDMRRSKQAIPYAVFCSYRLSTDVAYRCITNIYRDHKLAFSDDNCDIYLEANNSEDANQQHVSMHRARLVPDLGLWNTLIERPENYHRYTVTQEIVPVLNTKTPACASFIIQYSFECGLALANSHFLPTDSLHLPAPLGPSGIPSDLEYAVNHVQVYDTSDSSALHYVHPSANMYPNAYLDAHSIHPSDINLITSPTYELDPTYQLPY